MGVREEDFGTRERLRVAKTTVVKYLAEENQRLNNKVFSEETMQRENNGEVKLVE